ncbi:WD40 repeat-like protein [Lentinula aff. lateritia]|uniref:WD40 repeat-like protein n=1 Tax=Lentinula aff. lateritia TaxID=2804960 RepID=A0ACC1UES3_9AGAR|nr:WD40 repeat-like protein [Lentinula aff. lateritia]
MNCHEDPSLIRPYLDRSSFPSYSLSTQIQKRALGQSLARTWDRVKVLGGHAGCINTLHWARGGELLLSAGDDTTVQIWRLDPTSTFEDYPFVCRTVIHTGHRANIFNTAMLPYSHRIATVSGDRQVRVFDVGEDYETSVLGQEIGQKYCLSTLRCHEDRVKRIATEESPDRFLTVSEDGTVRQHDLRTPHVCSDHCPAPLLQVHHELSTLATSSYYCVVAGDSPYAYLFDRRFTGRDIPDEWGRRDEGLVSCVLRFGRTNQRKVYRTRTYRREHITGAKMSAENGHEVLLSYSSDGVYLFSTLHDPESSSSLSSTIVPPNLKRRRISRESEYPSTSSSTVSSSPPSEGAAVNLDFLQGENEDSEEDDVVDPLRGEEQKAFYSWTDIVTPYRRFSGARNVDTVKDVNFLGPRDEFVTSGSDDGNFFVWHKSTGKIHGIYEGDGAVVNVIEGHPHLPLVAVSGIDHTVKLFAPVHRESAFSRMSNAESIMDMNREQSDLRTHIRRIRRRDLANLLASFSTSTDRENATEATSDCVNQ